MVSLCQGNGKTQILIRGGENEIGRIEVCGSRALQRGFVLCMDVQMAPHCLVWVEILIQRLSKFHARKITK